MESNGLMSTVVFKDSFKDIKHAATTTLNQSIQIETVHFEVKEGVILESKLFNFGVK